MNPTTFALLITLVFINGESLSYAEDRNDDQLKYLQGAVAWFAPGTQAEGVIKMCGEPELTDSHGRWWYEVSGGDSSATHVRFTIDKGIVVLVEEIRVSVISKTPDALVRSLKEREHQETHVPKPEEGGKR